MEPNKVYLFVRPGGNQSYTLYFTPTEQLMEEVTVNASNIPAGVNISFDISPKGNPRSVQRREEKTDVCRENGVLVCGQCECYQPYSGRFCQKGEEDVSLLACRSGPHAPVCSGRGSCEGGFCLCNTPVDSMERFSGQFCEWSNFQCPQYNKKICRGKGSCEGGTCVCDEGWTGEDCGCTTNVTGCMAYNQQVCNGNGMCECGLCKCKLPFYGPTCEMCFTCPGTCVTRADCVECRGFGTGVKNSSCDRECGFFSLSIVENSDDLPEPGYKTAHCKMRSSAGDFCFFYFTYSFTPSGEHATVARDKDCPSEAGAVLKAEVSGLEAQLLIKLRFLFLCKVTTTEKDYEEQKLNNVSTFMSLAFSCTNITFYRTTTTVRTESCKNVKIHEDGAFPHYDRKLVTKYISNSLRDEQLGF
uniref:Integrin beta subunit tail domain-containing protein n=1 Tax=Gouania willdenowi TaxID=441366 RepID=A0A8C5H178_GOUWI